MAGLKGGTDLNCGAIYGEAIQGAVKQGLVEEAEVDTALHQQKNNPPLWTFFFDFAILTTRTVRPMRYPVRAAKERNSTFLPRNEN